MAKRKRNTRDRFSYLQELVTEFQDTASMEAKEQVLANLANFAYDPDNYGHFKALHIVDLFLDQLDEGSENLVEFAMGGICNLALEKSFKEMISPHKIIKCLSSNREETVLSAIATLMFLTTPQSKKDIVTAPVIDCMRRFQQSSNTRFSNLATVFLQDYCTQTDLTSNG